MTRAQIERWIGFRFGEWSIFRERDGSTESFPDYFSRMESAPLGDWARAYWKGE